MVISELRRYLKSKYTIISFVMCYLPVCISYYFTYCDKQELYGVIMNPVEDVNIEIAKKQYEGINGFTYLFDFLFSSDYYIIFVIILSLSFGVILGGVEFENRTTGLGNIIFSRIDIRNGTYKILLAQVTYICIYVSAFFAILTSITLILFSANSNIEFSIIIPLNTSSSISCLCLIIEHMIRLLIYIILIIVMTYGVSHIVNNKYVVTFVPVMVYFVPLFVASILGYINKNVGIIASYFVADRYYGAIYTRYARGSVSVEEETFLPLILIVLSIIMFILYFKKIKKDYL